MDFKPIKLSVSLILVFLFSLSIVYAQDALYVLNNVNFPEQRIIDAIEDIGYDVILVDNVDIDTVVFSNYEFMVLADEIFVNDDQIPVNEYPALILNSRHMDDWHWVSKISTRSSSQPLTGFIRYDDHMITNGLIGEITIYSSSIPAVDYMHRYYRSLDLDSVFAIGNSSILEELNGIIVTAEPGTVLRDGYVSNTKSVFFGINEVDYWTNDAETLFKNSITWLTTDFYPPEITNINVVSITNKSVVVTWNTNKPADSKVVYGVSNTEVYDGTFMGVHSLLVDNLEEDTTYSFYVESCTSSGYCSQSSTDVFTTDDYTAPKLVSTSVQDITNNSAKVNVEIDEVGYSRLYYGPSLEMITPQSILGTNYQFVLSDLSERTTYYYIVEMCDDSSNCRNSTTYDFTTDDYTDPNEVTNLIAIVVNPVNQIRLEWTDAIDDTAFFNIYMANDPNSFDYNTPYDSTVNNYYVDISADIDGQRYYVVRAEDSHNNEEDNSNIVGKFDVSLHTGYNLISIPLTPFDNSIGAVMHQDISYNPVSEIKRFNGVTQSFESSIYNTGVWDTSIFSTIENGEGYFFDSGYSTDFTFVGTLPKTVVKDIKTGMNLFGIVSLDDKTIPEVIVQDSSSFNVTEIGKRNGDSKYTLATFNGGGWYNSFDLTPGKGYWLKANKNFNLNLGE